MFASTGAGGAVKSILAVAVISPFYLIGFDVIPQAAEEINVSTKKIGRMLILPEWGMVAAWSLLGGVFFAVCKSRYKESFGSMVQLISDEDAAAAYKASGADFIVAFGGGSPMDVAKTVGVVVKYGGKIEEYEGAHSQGPGQNRAADRHSDHGGHRLRGHGVFGHHRPQGALRSLRRTETEKKPWIICPTTYRST